MWGLYPANGENLIVSFFTNTIFGKEDTVENWKPITGFEGIYEVSDTGRVRSLSRDIVKSNGVVQHRTGRLKKNITTPDGYFVVNLSKSGTIYKKFVHVLVATEFVDGYFDDAEINHKDFNRKNNCYTNLEWVSHIDNIAHTLNNGRHVTQIRSMSGKNNPNYGNHKLRERYSSNKELSKTNQSRPGVLNGRSKKVRAIFNDGTSVHFGYIGECAEYLISNNVVRSKSVSSVSTYISNAARNGSKYYGIHFTFI